MENIVRNPLDPTPKMRTKKNENNARLAKTLTAPFIAATTNGGSVIRINMEKTFFLATITPPLIHTVTFPKVGCKDSPFFKVHPAKYKSILMNVVPLTSKIEASKAATALPQLPGTCLCIIKTQTAQMTT